MNTANINTTSSVKRYISEIQELWGLKNLSAKQIKIENNTKNQFEYCLQISLTTAKYEILADVGCVHFTN